VVLALLVEDGGGLGRVAGPHAVQRRVGQHAQALGVGAEHVEVAAGVDVDGADRLLVLDRAHRLEGHGLGDVLERVELGGLVDGPRVEAARLGRRVGQRRGGGRRGGGGGRAGLGLGGLALQLGRDERLVVAGPACAEVARVRDGVERVVHGGR